MIDMFHAKVGNYPNNKGFYQSEWRIAHMHLKVTANGRKLASKIYTCLKLF